MIEQMKIVFIEKFSIDLYMLCFSKYKKKITLLDIIVRSNSIWDMYYNDKIILLRITGTQVKAFFYCAWNTKEIKLPF